MKARTFGFRWFYAGLGIVLLGLAASFSLAHAADTQQTTYKLGNGDLVEVNVYNHPELSKQMRVRPDGWISLPLVGEIPAAGYTPGNLSSVVRVKLLYYLKDPKVSVIVHEYASKKILVIGDVKTPGLYQFEGAMTAFDAVGAAGGYNKHAELKSILIVHDGYSKKPAFQLANMHQAIHDGNLSGNVKLVPGDIVYVPQNFIGNVADFLDFWMSRVRPAADTYFLYDIARDDN